MAALLLVGLGAMVFWPDPNGRRDWQPSRFATNTAVEGGQPMVETNRSAAERIISELNASDEEYVEVPGGIPIRSPHEEFAGSAACATCHREIYETWSRSTHGRAGGLPSEVDLLARFNGQPLRFRDAVVTPTTNENGRARFVVEIPGQPAWDLEVNAVVGGGHMHGGGTQSFFIRFADGTYRFLPFDYIRDEATWFVQLRGDMTWVPVHEGLLLMNDLANWPPHRVLGSSLQFSNCQNCHGSQITLDYDPQAGRHETKFTSLNINCESCHGPGRRHVALAQQPGFAERSDIGMDALATYGKDQSLQVCFQCHATKDVLRSEPYLPGQDLTDFYSVGLPFMTESPLLPDGRVARFAYQLNHRYSDCYLSGSMTCVDCHDPHALNYRDVRGRSLAGKFDNGQCTSCHASKGLALEAHTHHAPDSAGSRCTSCHMPFLQHQGVGQHLVFARADHTIPIPRPRGDAALGIENACRKCHGEQTLEWQETKVREWWGETKPRHSLVEAILAARQVSEREEAATLLLRPDSGHGLAQVNGVTDFLKRFVRPQEAAVSTNILGRFLALSRNGDLDVRALALMALHVAWGEHGAAQARVEKALLTDGDDGESQAVRRRWAIAADHWGNQFAAGGDFRLARMCFDKSLEVDEGNVVAWTHLARAALQLGETEEALRAQRRAIALAPEQAVLHFQLGQILMTAQRIEEAIASVEEGLRYAPDDERARQMLQYLRGR